MRHHSIATPWHVRQYSFEDLKKYLSSHEDFFDNIFEKTAETVIIIITAGCIYKIIQLIYTSNFTHQIYTVALQGLNSMNHIYTTALQGFL
jgi:hypothetical protein